MKRLLAILALCLLPSTAFAAIAFDSGLTSAGASFSFTNTAGNFMELVCVSNTSTAMSATYNSVAMTAKADQQMDTQANWIQVFTLMSPATGANTVAVTGANKVFNCTAVSYSGVKTTTQPEVVTPNSAPAAQSITKSLTTLSDNNWVIAAFGANGVPASYTNVTARAGNTFPYVGDSNAVVHPAGALSQTADLGAGNGTTPWAMVQIAIAPSVAAATPLTSILGLVRAFFIW
jgi:hypothetical protein